MRLRLEKLVLALSEIKSVSQPAVVSGGTGQAGDCPRPSPALCKLRATEQSVESGRQLLVPVTTGGSFTLCPGFHTLKRKLCTSPSASRKSEIHGKCSAPVTVVYDCHITKKEDSRPPTACQIRPVLGLLM